MRIDLRLGAATDLADIATIGRRAERVSAAALWSSEAGHDPFLAAQAATLATTTTPIGTGVAVAYARTPMATAQAAWDLQRVSGGRFILGLGTQVRAHIQRRYGTTWPGGASAMAEYITAMRAIWSNWQHGETPSFVGSHWQFLLSSPEFAPDPLPDTQCDIPVWLAAVGPGLASLAGEVANGVHVHSFHTVGYLQDTFLPAVRRGAATAGRVNPRLSSPVFAGVAHSEQQSEVLRNHFAFNIGFYGATSAYRAVFDQHGWGELHERLRGLARQGRWDDLAAQIPDEVTNEFVLIDKPAALGRRLAQRYDGVLDQLGLYRGGDQFMSEQDWDDLVAAAASATTAISSD